MSLDIQAEMFRHQQNGTHTTVPAPGLNSDHAASGKAPVKTPASLEEESVISTS